LIPICVPAPGIRLHCTVKANEREATFRLLGLSLAPISLGKDVTIPTMRSPVPLSSAILGRRYGFKVIGIDTGGRFATTLFHMVEKKPIRNRPAVIFPGGAVGINHCGLAVRRITHLSITRSGGAVGANPAPRIGINNIPRRTTFNRGQSSLVLTHSASLVGKSH
jgi:hypothetical protein